MNYPTDKIETCLRCGMRHYIKMYWFEKIYWRFWWWAQVAKKHLIS